MLSAVFLLLIHACECKKKKRDFISLVRWCLCPLPPRVSVTKRARSAGRAAKPPCRWCHPSRRHRKSHVCVRAICYSRQVCFIWVPLETKDWVICNVMHKGSASKEKSIFFFIILWSHSWRVDVFLALFLCISVTLMLHHYIYSLLAEDVAERTQAAFYLLQ